MLKKKCQLWFAKLILLTEVGRNIPPKPRFSQQLWSIPFRTMSFRCWVTSRLLWLFPPLTMTFGFSDCFLSMGVIRQELNRSGCREGKGQRWGKNGRWKQSREEAVKEEQRGRGTASDHIGYISTPSKNTEPDRRGGKSALDGNDSSLGFCGIWEWAPDLLFSSWGLLTAKITVVRLKKKKKWENHVKSKILNECKSF